MHRKLNYFLRSNSENNHRTKKIRDIFGSRRIHNYSNAKSAELIPLLYRSVVPKVQVFTGKTGNGLFCGKKMVNGIPLSHL